MINFLSIPKDSLSTNNKYSVFDIDGNFMFMSSILKLDLWEILNYAVIRMEKCLNGVHMEDKETLA